jgi:hypothetical protein
MIAFPVAHNHIAPASPWLYALAWPALLFVSIAIDAVIGWMLYRGFVLLHELMRGAW